MAEISISGRMTVKGLKSQFKTAFGATLRVYNGVRFADDSATLASIRSDKAKTTSADLKVNGNLSVGNFEKNMKKTFGITVRVANKKDTDLATSTQTLSGAGKS